MTLSSLRVWPSCLVCMLWLAGVAGATASAHQQRTVWDAVYSNDQADRGQKLYDEHCGRCHGDGLGGVESAPPLTGAEFGSNWEGIPIADLLERMRASMPQDRPGSLSREQNAEILAYMLRVGGFPSGEHELPGDAGLLKQIVFRLYKP